ncbi:MAG TPA: hypothetical protein EYP55_12030 [Anaerolineae bacterium]|nr:hypothetical protein [Anaerolineae bacterium]
MAEELPSLVQEIWAATQAFMEAVQTEDAQAIGDLLVPRSEAGLAYGLFGFGPLGILLGLHLGYPGYALVRLGQKGENIALAEIGWLTGEEEGEPIIDTDLLSTITWRRYRRKWRVEAINPAPMDNPLTLPVAREMLDELDEEDDWLPYALLAGAVQFQRVGPEELDDVETLFVEGMQERMFGLQEIVIAVRLWRDFKRRASPTYRKPEVYAAAVEYIMILLGFYKGSQTGVGKDYGVSAATVASKYKEIEQRLGIYQYDERYSIHEDPSAPFRAMWKELGVKGPPKIPLGAGRPGKGFDMRLW